MFYGMYAVIRDFAAPVATTIAAGVAAFVTISIQRQNHRLAKERFRLDMYDKRLLVYQAVIELLLKLLSNPAIDDPEADLVLRRSYAKMNEATFLCGPTAQAFCAEVRAANNAWRVAKGATVYADTLPPGKDRIEVVLAPVKATQTVLDLLDRAVGAFASDLKVRE